MPLSLSSPWWLLGFSLLPLLWWLHRFRRRTVSSPVSALFLLRRFHQPAGGGAAAAKPDPLWRLRALFTALLVMTLTAPFWERTTAPPIQVWVDDSISMYALERGTPRITLALRTLADELRQGKTTRLTLHSLARPGESLRLDTKQQQWLEQMKLWSRKPRGEPTPPVPGEWKPGTLHYLITDGADRKLNQWLLSAPLDRLIRVGQATENLALTALATRPTLSPAGRLQGLATLSNLGTKGAAGELVIEQGQKILLRRAFELSSGRELQVSFELSPLPPDGLVARIRTQDQAVTDALPLDDVLRLDTSPAPVPLYMQKACGPFVEAALQVHPGVRLVDQPPAAAGVTIVCVAEPAEIKGPTLQLYPVKRALQTAGLPLWHASAGPLRQLLLPETLEYSRSAPLLPVDGIPLLSKDDRALIIDSPAPFPYMKIFLPMLSMDFVRDAAFPALLAGLLDRLLKRRLLDGIRRLEYDAVASRIAPLPMQQPASASEVAGVHTRMDLSWIFLLISILVLFFELAWNPRYRNSGERGTAAVE
jgi:hypothetical protein